MDAPIYLDNAASTRVSDEVLALMTEVMRTAWGNPSAQHPQGAAARAYIETARGRLLAALGGAGTGDIVWTSGCTEADALAVLGAARVKAGPIVLSTIEHPAVGALAAPLAADGREIRAIAPGADGVLDPEAVAAAAEGAAVAAIVMVQNELGVVQPVAAIASAIRRRAPSCHIHIDAAQAFGKIAIDAHAIGADTIAIAGHKLHGPSGCGALWLRTGVQLAPLWVGGGQQRGLRGGTQNAAGAAGLGLAAERAVAALATARARWLEFAAHITARLVERGVAFRQLVPDERSESTGGGDPTGFARGAGVLPRGIDQRRSPHILALGFPGVPAPALRTVMASRGVYLSTGSACAERDAKPSAALAAIGLLPDTGMGRLSFGLDTTLDHVAAATEILADVASELSRTAART